MYISYHLLPYSRITAVFGILRNSRTAITMVTIAALLASAGYGFSDTPVFDRIVRYFISRGVYRIVEINKALFAFGEPQLGG